MPCISVSMASGFDFVASHYKFCLFAVYFNMY